MITFAKQKLREIKMNIDYSNNKTVKCYRAFVENPENTKAKRAFDKLFGNTLAEEAVRLHKRLVNSLNAAYYNSMFGKPKNCIELMQATKDKEPKVFKVRVGLGPRKFFHQIIDEDGTFLLTKDWKGDYSKVESLFVIDVNNHDYKSI